MINRYILITEVNRPSFKRAYLAEITRSNVFKRKMRHQYKIKKLVKTLISGSRVPENQSQVIIENIT